MSLINKEIEDFSVQAFHNDSFTTVTRSDVAGKWSVFFFYPADFTFVCPTELEDLNGLYDEFQKAGCEIYSVSTDTHSSTRRGTMLPRTSVRCAIPCWPIPPMRFLACSRC